MSRDSRELIDRLTRRLAWQGWVANGLGAAVVFFTIGFLLAIVLSQDESDQIGRENLPWMVAMVVVGGIVVRRIFRRHLTRTVAWLLEGREPDADEHRATLKLPVWQAMTTVAAWVLAGIVALLLNLDHSVGVAALIAASIWLGGETTAALSYLLAERAMRPVAERALAVREPSGPLAPGVSTRLLFSWSLGTGVPIIALLVVGLAGLATPGVEADQVAAGAVFLSAVAIVVGLLVAKVTARSLSDPLRSMRAAMERVGDGELGATVTVDDASEVGLMQAEFNRMAGGLRERERIRDIFGRQVGQAVAREALRSGTRLGGEEREVGALFVDLVGSTSMALAMPPTEVVRLLNRFFRIVVEVIESEGGIVNKFEGDAALCVFGAPVASADPAGDALRAARRLSQRLREETPEIGFGVGVSAGRAVAGNVGSEQRFEYTVIGDPVNEAARLSDLAKERSEDVLASESALRRAGPAEREGWSVGESTILRGRLEATGLASPIP